MLLFVQRFFGALALDRATFEDIEADPKAGWQSLMVVGLACLAGGLAALNVATTELRAFGFATGVALTLGGWVVWALLINTLGTQLFAEPQTHSNAGELLRTLGFAAAPAVFLAFASMRSAAPFVVAVVTVWLIADAMLAVRQSLDYRSTLRAIAVCVIAALLSVAFIGAVAMLFSATVR